MKMNPELEITPDMILAGVKAYELWNYEKEDVECMIASVFLTMEEIKATKLRAINEAPLR